jgi:tetratricopeptide (TPR) repeat protein
MNQTEDWRPGQRTVAGEATQVRPPRAEDARIVRALEEYLAAARAGQPPDRADFLARHADVAEALVPCLDGLHLVETASVGVPRAPASDGQPPSLLGDYRILRELGRGGMGVVYEAEQVSLRRRVALKVLPLAVTLDSRQRQRFLNEAQTAAHLHHAHIVPVFAVGCERGVHFYAMQFIDGHNLAEVIADWRLQKADGDRATAFSIRSATGVRTAAAWGVETAEALEYAHGLGIIHRDIKPANLLVDTHGHLWVTDFGLALCQGEATLTMSGDLVGTLRYMSPEQALARRGFVDHRTDVYSLGATLYELLTLEPVFPGQDRQELLGQIAQDEPQRPRRLNRAIPAGLENIVLKALAKNPSDRYGTAQELADDLHRFLNDRPIRARRPSVVERALRWARRHRAVVMAAAAVLIVALVALAGSVVSIWLEKEQTEEEKNLADAARGQAVTETELAENARRMADRETRRARQALRDEYRQREVAEANLGLALAALDDYVAQAEANLPRDFQREQDEQQVVAGVLAFYQEFLRKNPGHLRVRRSAVAAHDRLGLLQRRLGRFEAARAAYVRALALTAGLVKESPRNFVLRGQVATLHMELAYVLRALGRTREAEQAYRRSLVVLQGQTADFPAAPAAQKEANQRLRGQALTWLGILLRDDRRFDEAGKVLAESRGRWQALVSRRGSAEDWYGLGHCRNNQGLLLAYTGRLREAERAHLQAEEIFARLARDHPNGGSAYLNDLAAARYNLGNALFDRGPARAEEFYRAAAKVREQLVRDYPTVFEYREKLGRVYGNLAQLLEKQDRLTEARAFEEAAIRAKLSAFQTSGEHPGNRQGLCIAYVNLARFYLKINRPTEVETAYASALDVAAKLAQDYPGEADYRRLPAEVYQARADARAAFGQYAPAAGDYRAAVALWRKLTVDFPGRHLEFADQEGYTCLTLGETLVGAGQPGEAEDAFRAARGVYEKLAAESPRTAAYHSNVAAALHQLAEALGRRRQWEPCRALALKAVDRQKEALRLAPKHARFGDLLQDHFGLLVTASAGLGDHAAIARTAAEFGRCYSERWEDAYRARRFLLLCAAVAAKDARLSAEEYPARIQDYTRKAAGLLAEAVRRCGADPVACLRLAWPLATEADPRYGDAVQAVALARKAVAARPRERIARQILGVASYRAGDWKTATTELEESVRQGHGGDSIDWFFLAMARWQAADRDRAGQAYRRGVEFLKKYREVPEQVQAFKAEAARLLGIPEKG